MLIAKNLLNRFAASPLRDSVCRVYKYLMLYILLFDVDNCLEFTVIDCAYIYQMAWGGELYSVALPITHTDS